MSSALVWHCIRDFNASIRKNCNGTVMSAEAGNLYNKHSYKYSGLANDKTVDIQATDDAISFTVSKSTKSASKPNKAKASYTIKKGPRRAIGSIGKQVSSYRPDLTNAAKARLAHVAKSLRVQKAASK